MLIVRCQEEFSFGELLYLLSILFDSILRMILHITLANRTGSVSFTLMTRDCPWFTVKMRNHSDGNYKQATSRGAAASALCLPARMHMKINALHRSVSSHENDG